MDMLYHKGYLEGYMDGLRAARNRGETEIMMDEITQLPIGAMELSRRAQNCLERSGCIVVSDVISIDEYTIKTMRNLGRKTASEIARWLEANGIYNTAWSLSLYE